MMAEKDLRENSRVDASAEGSLLRGRSVNRREFIKMAGIAGAALGLGGGLGGLLAACGGETTTSTTIPTSAGSSTTAQTSVVPTSTASATTSSSLTTKKGDLLVFSLTSLSFNYFVAMEAGAKQAAEALGLAFQCDANEMSAATEIAQFETAVAKGVKMIAACPLDASPTAQLAEIISEAQCHYVNLWEMPDWETPWTWSDYYTSYLTRDSINDGYVQAKTLFNAMGGQGGFIHLTGWPNTPDWQRTLGVDNALKEFPNVTLLERHATKWDRVTAQNLMDGYIVKYGKDIKGVFGQNDEIAIGAMRSLEAAKIPTGVNGVPITGIDGISEALGYVGEGRLTADLTSLPFWQGAYCVAQAFDARNGWKPSAAERQMYSAGFVVDSSNAAAFIEKFNIDKPLPYDYTLMSHVLHPNDWDPQNLLIPFDMDHHWQGRPKPPDFEYPADYAAAKSSGEFDQTADVYEEHYKIKIM